MVNRSASSVGFGFIFQTNAAIVLMIENIKELKSIRIEGDNEDIDIELNGNRHILSQSKAVVKGSSDFRKCGDNLKKSLLTLSEGCKKVKVDKAIYATNSFNPFHDEESKRIFYGYTFRSFKDLPSSAKQIIKETLQKQNIEFDYNKFHVCFIPFETDVDRERYKVVWECIRDFVQNITDEQFPSPRRLHEIWENHIFNNGTKADKKIVMSKEDIIWPLIYLIVSPENFSHNFTECFPEVMFDEVNNKYKEIINTCTENVQVFIKIMSDFNSCKKGNSFREQIINFANDNWENYLQDLSFENLDKKIAEELIKLIIYSVIARRHKIEKIKERVCL